MLTPKQLSELPDNVVALYEELEDDIIRDMARRIVKTNFATESTQWQLSRLQEMGTTHDEVFNRLSKATGKSDEELIAMFNEAAEEAYKADKKAYNKAGYNPIPLAENQQLQKIINAGLVKTQALFKNLTNTTANTATQQFENALDTAYMQITSGAFDYNTAIRNCIKTLAEKGIATIKYPTGHTDYLDVAVRRAALTGVGQTTGEMQMALAEEMGCDLVEVTAHNGARPSHMEWQGKVYSISGAHPKYPDFVKSTGYGTGDGLKGWNCRHDFFPFFEDSEPAYTQEELNEYENRKVTYNGVEMTEYDASQKQRAYERRIRATKRELSGLDSAIKETDNETLKESLQAEFDRKSVLLKKQEDKIKDFTHQTGLYRDRAREQSYGFNKSVSQKAVWSNKKRSIKENNLNSTKRIIVEKTKNSSIINVPLSDTDIKAIQDYISSESYTINGKLRNGMSLTPEDQEFIKNLDNALKKMPTYEGNLTRSLLFIYDDEIPAFIEKHTVGNRVTYKEYLSTTKGPIYNPDGQVQIVIEGAKKGRDISSLNDDEKEVLYERNASFIVKYLFEKDDKYYIWLVEE